MEEVIRLLAFGLTLCGMLLWEALRPRRAIGAGRWQRWMANFGLGVSSVVLLRLTLGGVAISVAQVAQLHGWGFLNVVAIAPLWGGVLTLILLDLAIYGQHVAAHHWRWLWRLHRIHHSDIAVDSSTALRFHPVEIGLSTVFKSLCIILIGADPMAVLLFEIWLSSNALFNHGNVQLPRRLDAVLRWVLVTPDMHRVHHSCVQSESDRNFGFALSIWDRCFNTYQAAPKAGYDRLVLGLEGVPRRHASLWQLLKWPLRS